MILTEEARSSEVNILARPKSPATKFWFCVIDITNNRNQQTG